MGKSRPARPGTASSSAPGAAANGVRAPSGPAPVRAGAGAMVGPGGGAPLENANPLIYRRSGERPVTAREEDDELPDSIDDREIFDILAAREGRAGPGGGGRAGRLRAAFLNPAHLIRSINDPEHPLTLEELNVVEQVRVKVRGECERSKCGGR